MAPKVLAYSYIQIFSSISLEWIFLPKIEEVEKFYWKATFDVSHDELNYMKNLYMCEQKIFMLWSGFHRTISETTRKIFFPDNKWKISQCFKLFVTQFIIKNFFLCLNFFHQQKIWQLMQSATLNFSIQ